MATRISVNGKKRRGHHMAQLLSSWRPSLKTNWQSWTEKWLMLTKNRNGHHGLIKRLCVHVFPCVHVCARTYPYPSPSSCKFLSQQQVNYHEQQSTQGLPSYRISIRYLYARLCTCVCADLVFRGGGFDCVLFSTHMYCTCESDKKKRESLTLTPKLLCWCIIHLSTSCTLKPLKLS